MTNIALLARVHPEAFARIGPLVFMGGGRERQQRDGRRRVQRLPRPRGRRRRARRLRRPRGAGRDVRPRRLLRPQGHRRRRRGAPRRRHPGGPARRRPHLVPPPALRHDGATIGDAGAVAMLLAPDAVRTERRPVRVELSGTWTRGRTIVDTRDWSGDMAHDPHGVSPAMVEVALEIDGPRIAKLWLDTRRRGGPMTGRVLVLGSLNVDLVTRVESHPRPGRPCSARACAASPAARRQPGRRRGGGRRRRRDGRCVGDDDGGRAYRERLARLGIDVEAVRVSRARPPATPSSRCPTTARTRSSSCRRQPPPRGAGGRRRPRPRPGRRPRPPARGPPDRRLRGRARGRRPRRPGRPQRRPVVGAARRRRGPRRPRRRQRARDAGARRGGRAASLLRHLRGQTAPRGTA